MSEYEYNFNLLKEENLAYDMFYSIHKYIEDIKGYSSLYLDKSYLNRLSFEIINDFYNKNVMYSYVIKKGITNIKIIEFHLKMVGINRTFIDNSDPDKKQYLAIIRKKI